MVFDIPVEMHSTRMEAGNWTGGGLRVDILEGVFWFIFAKNVQILVFALKYFTEGVTLNN